MRIPAFVLTTLAILPMSAAFSQSINENATKQQNEITIQLPTVPKWLKTFKFEQTQFTFVRIQYESYGFRGGQRWATDFPDADVNFASQLGKFTGLDVSKPAVVMRLTDPELKKHPFIYIAEPGSMAIKEEEVVALRNYLNGGGFLLVDDFWGNSEWDDVAEVLKKVFPDRKPRELPLDHPIFHCVFDLKEKPQVLSIHTFAVSPGAIFDAPKYYAIEDDQGRVMALMCHNTDLADGWERAGEDVKFKREMSEAKAFPMGFNIVYYALTGGKVKSN